MALPVLESSSRARIPPPPTADAPTGGPPSAPGYEPHHFAVSTESGVEATEFGMLHRARSPFRPFRGLMVAVHAPFVVDCVDRFRDSSRAPVCERYAPHTRGLGAP